MARDDRRYEFVTDCIHSDYESIHDLKDHAEEISLRTFQRKLAPGEWKALSERLGYDRWFPMSRDWHVGYFRSRYQGVPAVYAVWSGIEQIFTLDGQ